MKIFRIAMIVLLLSTLASTPAFPVRYNASARPDGTALSAVATAQQEQICVGQSTQLIATATGGTSNYTYTWTSDPPGFNSSSTDAFVSPVVTTTYTVTVTDGSSTATGSVTVVVNPLPRVEITPVFNENIRVSNSGQISVCVFDSVTLDAGNPGSIYLWNDGSTDRMITAQSSGISYAIQDYTVSVTDPSTGCSNSNDITVEFTFTDCSYGVEEMPESNIARLYPNPSTDGIFELAFEKPANNTLIEVFNGNGLMVYKTQLNTAGSANSLRLDLSSHPNGIYYLRTGPHNMKLIILR